MLEGVMDVMVDEVFDKEVTKVVEVVRKRGDGDGANEGLMRRTGPMRRTFPTRRTGPTRCKLRRTKEN